MRFLVLAVFATLTGFGVAAAGEAEKKVEIKVVKTGGGADTDIHWVGNGTDIDDLDVGESKTLEDGVVVTRGTDGLTIDVDGEIIVVPDINDHGTKMAFVGNSGLEEDIDVRVVRMHDGGKQHHVRRAHTLENGIMIASGEEIDADTQETIRSVLATAGYDNEVHFVDPGERHVTIIDKQEVTSD